MAAFSVWALIYIPPWCVNKSVGLQVLNTPIRAFELENEVRKTLTQIILGAFGLLVLYTTWRRMEAGDETVRIADQGHITDRYTKAVEQLGKLESGEPNIEVRLGAIYALERIAIDSVRDHQTIVEVLCAYVRRNAMPPRTVQLDVEQSDDEHPRIDIQAILTVLGRRQMDKRRKKPPMRLDLSGAYLNGANLDGAHLGGVKLDRAKLVLAGLYDAHLEGASLAEAHLERASLVNSHLEGANLSGVRMEKAILRNAGLGGANLIRAHLKGANLQGSHLERATLFGAHLEEARLEGAHLEEAFLEGAHLEGALLYGTHLEGARCLTVDQVKSAIHWERAHYDPEFRRELGFPDDTLAE